MNEWGLPDWHDPSSYGDVQVWSNDRWRWEFYRRRDDLRAFFDRWAATSFKENHRANEGRHPEDPGFLAVGRSEDAGRAIEEFDYAGVPNPRISEQPAIAIKPYSALVYHLRFYDPETRTPSSRGVIKRPAEEYRVWLKPNQMAIKFDLDEPLGLQIKDARKALEISQKERHGKSIKKPRHKSLWLGYLRVLDAREAGASWQNVVDVLFADGALNARATPEGGEGLPPPQAARDKWESANALRYDF